MKKFHSFHSYTKYWVKNLEQQPPYICCEVLDSSLLMMDPHDFTLRLQVGHVMRPTVLIFRQYLCAASLAITSSPHRRNRLQASIWRFVSTNYCLSVSWSKGPALEAGLMCCVLIISSDAEVSVEVKQVWGASVQLPFISVSKRVSWESSECLWPQMSSGS